MPFIFMLRIYFHALDDEQDIRKMGGSFIFYLDIYCNVFRNLCLTGFPMLAGYYSKDLLLETALVLLNRNVYIYICNICSIFNIILFFRALY